MKIEYDFNNNVINITTDEKTTLMNIHKLITDIHNDYNEWKIICKHDASLSVLSQNGPILG